MFFLKFFCFVMVNIFDNLLIPERRKLVYKSKKALLNWALVTAKKKDKQQQQLAG
jgi:hypothetical protein